MKKRTGKKTVERILFTMLTVGILGYLQYMPRSDLENIGTVDLTYEQQENDMIIESPYEEGFYNEVIPETDGDVPYVEINGNTPYFKAYEYRNEAFEYYGELDELGRCSFAMASIGKEIMPTEERGEIGQVKPTGWQTIKYDCVDGKYLYNRCHLIGYQLSGENANERNLITGTRYLNIEGMLPYENQIADYVHLTDNHVLYRVTPVFDGENFLAKGVLLEAYSIEDKGEGIEFCVFAYNIQPGIEIDYATGNSILR